MNLDQFSTVVDDQRYINPQVALDESNAFIQNLRDTQQARTSEIARDTYNLGTAVPSNLGGLGGSDSYFTSRYQTPQTNTLIADLKATAQAQALSDAMNNAVAQAKQRYNNAYKKYSKRHSGSGGTTGTTGTTPANPTTGGTDKEDTTENPFWTATRTKSQGNDVVYYGLYKLTRNEGESDNDWAERSNKWIAQMDIQNSMRRKYQGFTH